MISREMFAISKVMKITTKKLEDIIPYERNNRTHDQTQIDRLANSIKDFGFNQPIVLDKSGVIVAGHGRYFAAKKLKLDAIPCVVKDDLSDAQLRAYRILDNKLQNDSTWEFSNLELELDMLQQDGFELEPWGLESLKLPDKDPLDEPEQENKDREYLIVITCQNESDQRIKFEHLETLEWQAKLI